MRSLRAPPGLAALRSWCRVGLGMPRALLDPALGLRPGLSRRASRLHGLPRPFQSLSRVSSLPELPGSLTRCLHSPGNGHSLSPNHGCLRSCASQELEGSHGPRSSSCLSHPDRAHTRCSGTELKPFWCKDFVLDPSDCRRGEERGEVAGGSIKPVRGQSWNLGSWEGLGTRVRMSPVFPVLRKQDFL